ncbi:tRNA (adenosine(37)-N6)-threonylcarbamoyltransferase complex dimerization subunit type 1 TsaB [Flavobacteriaceae bacterium M23B6Z8]
MAVILQIETTTTNCSVGISKDGSLLALKEAHDQKYMHAESLHLFIEEALKDASFSLADIEAIAVSKGPGSYTGLRIGVSAAKGLCFALDKPLLSVSTLESLARKLSVTQGLLVPMLDARRMEVYTAVLDYNYEVLKPVWAEIISEDSFATELSKGEVHFFGNGAEKCKSVLKHMNAVFHDDILLPSAKEMTSIAYQKFKTGDVEDTAYFEPYYLKDFIGIKPKK